MNAVAEVETSMVVSSDGPILFYDGGCALCHGAVRRLLQWERDPGAAPLRFAPLEGVTATEHRQRGRLSTSLEAVVLIYGERHYSGEEAVGEALRHIGRPGWSKAFRCCPAFLRRWGYRRIARHRTRWFGRVALDCPTPAGPARMLP